MKNTSSELSSSSTDDRDGDITKLPSNGSQRDVMTLVLLFTTREPASELERVLMNAAMEDKTVIIAALNEAWVAPNSIFDLFLESFHVGIGTEKYLKHVIGVCVDDKAYERCLHLHLHPHCYLINATDYDQLSGKNNYMTPGYLKLIWRRMEFLREVLALGYNFLFTDADILWFRDPFPRFFPDVDFQIACDHYNGNSSSKRNWVNSGFTYVKANNKTIKFYEFWCGSRYRFHDRRKHDQEVFNLIKRDPFVDQIGIKMRFLDTLHIGTFCEPSKDVINQYLSERFSGNTEKAEARWRRRHRRGRRVK
ncbi:hypothetical protein Bca101_064860 [Brassica carinata]